MIDYNIMAIMLKINSYLKEYLLLIVLLLSPIMNRK